jgi:hypothetical protein
VAPKRTLPAVAAILALLVGVVVFATRDAKGQPPVDYLGLVPPGAVLPSDTDCAARVRSAPEVRHNQNAVPNRFGDVPNQTRGVAGAWRDGDPAKAPFTARVTGNFVGTTDEIIQWASCKWGIDEDVARAQIAIESWWDQANSLGDWSSIASRCDPRFPLGSVGGNRCPESLGLGQTRYPYMQSAFPHAYDSSAYNLDVTYAIWRSCFEGTETWLNTVERGRTYAAGDMWGCVGRWFAGRWYTQRAVEYISAVQDYLSRRIWETTDFIAYGGASPPPTSSSTTTSSTTTTSTTTTSSTTTTAPPATTTTAVPPMDGHHVACPGERDVTPMGALPPALPMLCDHLGPAIDTARRGVNSWIDDFDHGASMAALPASYVAGHLGPGGVSRHFLHLDHWMVDIRSDSGQYPTLLAAWMRPAQPFRPRADGSVVIEFEVATPIAGTRGVDGLSDSWPEFAVTSAAAPAGMNPWGSPFLRNGTYFYEGFPAADVMGCRIQQSRHPICAFYGAGSDGAGAPDREWEVNQNGTDVVPGSEFGGDPTVAGLGSAWASCSSVDEPDTACRNTFRITLTATHIRIDVRRPGGSFVRYYEATPCNDRTGCATGQMGRILNAPGGFYVYFADFAYRIANDEVIRFHWDRLAVNP